MIRKGLGYLGMALIATAFVAAFIAYFLVAVGPAGSRFDGFGRAIVHAPPIMRLIQVETWPGLYWWIFDFVAFWTAVGLGASLASFGFKGAQDSPHPANIIHHTQEHLDQTPEERVNALRDAIRKKNSN